MKKTDILKIRDVFRDEIKPLSDQVNLMHDEVKTHRMILGESEQCGQRGKVAELCKDMQDQKKFQAQVKAIAFTVLPMMQIGITAAGMWIKSIFSK